MWPFDVAFMQRALAAGLTVGIVAPLIGSFIVPRRLSMLGDGIGHLAFAGVALGIAAGIAPLPAALAVSVVGALGIEWLRRRGIAGDLVLAFVFYVGIAAAVVIISASGALDARVLSYLFGQILTVTTADVWAIAGLGAAILATLAVIGRAMFAVIVDEPSSEVAGLPVGSLGAALTVLVAVTVVLAMRVVGVLLVASLMVLPAGAAGMVARSFRVALVASSVIGASSVVVGLTIARAQPIAPGGAIVLVAAAWFVVAAAFGRRRLGRGSVRGAELSGPDAHAPHPHVH